MALQLRSGITRGFEADFVLDENGLRRVVGVLEAKSKELPYPTAVVFTVQRDDDRFYETIDIEDVLADPNTQDHTIRMLRIELRNSDPNRKSEPWDRGWIVLVRFGARLPERATIAVNSEDKGWALLLADELEPQVQRVMSARAIPSWLLVLLVLSIGIFVGVLAFKLFPPRSRVDIPFFALAIASTALGVSAARRQTGRRTSWLRQWAGPRSFFCWGDQIVTHSRHEEHRKNIQWVLIAGFFVSVVATIYTNVVLPTPSDTQAAKGSEQAASKPAP